MRETSDIRIVNFQPVISPRMLKNEFPMTEESNRTVLESRKIVDDIIAGRDPRLLAIVGPCSIHDPDSAVDYAGKLLKVAEAVKDEIYIVMRVYFEKPRTTIGWRGLLVDPDLDGSNNIEKGLKTGRDLLLRITSTGLPVGSEILDSVFIQYTSDLISWAAIGARTTESQTHREMASGLSMSVGFKNGTSGNLQLAMDAIKSSTHSHSFLGIDQDGKTSMVRTTGNDSLHIILRGGRSGPNYYEDFVEKAEELFLAQDLRPRIMIDCSHANSGKDYTKQERVLRSVIDQRSRGRSSIIGFMLESNLVEGKQTIPEDHSKLVYGQSITDSCLGWDNTEEILMEAHQILHDAKVHA